METEGVPKYINAIEDDQKQSKRVDSTIEVDTLLLIVTNTMLSTERFPRAKNLWEDLGRD